MVIQVENLSYEYPGARALDEVSFTIPKGSITALAGPNGAGKTTLMRCIAALTPPFSGTAKVDGLDIRLHPREVHRKLGYLSDFFGLYESLTVRQCLTYMARSRLIPEPDVAAHVARVATLLGLNEWLEKKAGALSRGWRQRLGIAQSIIHQPNVVLLDEPASGLDPEARQHLSLLFLRLRDEGMTLVVSSHILGELEDYCTAMIILRQGKIIEHSTIKAQEHQGRWLEISLTGDAAPHLAALRAQPGVQDASSEGSALLCRFQGDDRAQHQLLASLLQAGVPVAAFTPTHRRMQDIYMSHAQNIPSPLAGLEREESRPTSRFFQSKGQGEGVSS